MTASAASREEWRRLEMEGAEPRDSIFDRLYTRFGDRYLLFLLICAGASIPGLAFLGVSFTAPYFGFSFVEFLVVLAVVVPWMSLVAVAEEAFVANRLKPLNRWLREGRRPDLAVPAWQAAVVDLPRAILLGGGFAVLGGAGSTVFAGVYTGFSAIDMLAALVGVTAFVLAGTALHYLIWERALRPTIVEVAIQLPPDFAVERTSLSVSMRLLMLIPLTNVVTAFFTGSLAGGDISPELRPLVGLAVAIGITFLVALPLTLMLRRSLLLPLEVLLEAMGRVQRGDLDARLPVIAADEIGTIAQHFNSMLMGLRHREELREDLRASRARIVATADAERRRMERDLHDGAQQHLVLLKMKLGMLADRIKADPEGAEVMTEELKADLGTALAQLRDLAHGIYPAILEHEGLPGALRDAVDRSLLDATFESSGAGRYRPELEAAVYFCCLEALQNAAKHAGEDAKVAVRLAEQNGDLQFEVSDDGGGFDPAVHNGSAGLQNMADRIGALGGELKVESARGRGTAVVGSIPVGAESTEAQGTGGHAGG
jgi:signal transduction histidine kinase